MKRENEIEIQEEVTIEQEDKKFILEKGDKIRVLKDSTVESGMLELSLEYLKIIKSKGVNPSSIFSSVIRDLMEEYERRNGSLQNDPNAYEKFKDSFARAFKRVYGKQGFELFKRLNKGVYKETK